MYNCVLIDWLINWLIDTLIYGFTCNRALFAVISTLNLSSWSLSLSISSDLSLQLFSSVVISSFILSRSRTSSSDSFCSLDNCSCINVFLQYKVWHSCHFCRASAHKLLCRRQVLPGAGRPSVCPDVTRWYRVKTKRASVIKSSPSAPRETVLPGSIKSLPEIRKGGTPIEGVKWEKVRDKFAIFNQYVAVSQDTVPYMVILYLPRVWLLIYRDGLSAHRQSHIQVVTMVRRRALTLIKPSISRHRPIRSYTLTLFFQDDRVWEEWTCTSLDGSRRLS